MKASLLKQLTLTLLKLLLAGSFLSIFGGCGGAGPEVTVDNHPLIRKAKRKLQNQETEAAITLYNRALDQNSQLSRAHLELALVYDDYQEDYIRAIYHYQRYLELDPETEKRKLIDDAIRHARMAFAASLPNRPSEAVEVIHDRNSTIKRLQVQNKRLTDILEKRSEESMAARRTLDDQTEEATELVRQDPDPVDLPTPTPTPGANAPARKYKVQSGDSLSKISSKMYNTSARWKDIYDANKSRLSNEGDLRIGQELIIP